MGGNGQVNGVSGNWSFQGVAFTHLDVSLRGCFGSLPISAGEERCDVWWPDLSSILRCRELGFVYPSPRNRAEERASQRSDRQGGGK